MIHVGAPWGNKCVWYDELSAFVALGLALSAVPVSLPMVASLPSDSGGTATAAASGAFLTSVTPCRLLDTRQGAGTPVAAGATIKVQVAGRCGVSAGGRAVSVTVTATDASSPGFVTLTAAGSTRPNVSNVNFRPNSAVANSAVVALSSDGAIDVASSAPVHVLIDVAGVFSDAAGPVSAGRFVPLAPSRLVDTRGERTASGG